MEPVPSPEIYIDVGFYYMISVALQRRVWFGSLDSPVFPNQYVLLVGKPGVGKGDVTSVVSKFLSFHGYVPGKLDPNGVDIRSLETDIESFDMLGASNHDQLLFPRAASAGSYQAIARAMAQSTRAFTIGAERKPMTQSALHFVLDEFTSLFHEKAKDTVDFFLTCWTGNEPYMHETIGRGKDFIKAPCLSMIAGTQPDRLQELRDLKVVTSGLGRRLLIVYAENNRARAFFRKERTAEQKKARMELIRYLKVLSTASGPIKYSPAAAEWLEDYFVSGRSCVNKSQQPIVLEYEANKQMHMQKMCMAFHFAERSNWKPGLTLGEVSLETAQAAMKLLARIDAGRHLAFEYQGRSALAPVAQKIVSQLRSNGAMSRNELFAMNFADFDSATQCDEMLNGLIQAQKIQVRNERGNIKYLIAG
jgi:hypothetical protein